MCACESVWLTVRLQVVDDKIEVIKGCVPQGCHWQILALVIWVCVTGLSTLMNSDVFYTDLY
jgi:hypothetical protein